MREKEMKEMVREASQEQDLDDALRLIQDRLGVETGDFASIWWSGREEAWDDAEIRESTLLDYARHEYLILLEDQEEEFLILEEELEPSKEVATGVAVIVRGPQNASLLTSEEGSRTHRMFSGPDAAERATRAAAEFAAGNPILSKEA